MESITEERKGIIGKVEKIIEGIYKDETIEAKDYTQFTEKYKENFEDKVSKDADYKFEYKTEVRKEEDE